MNTVQKVGMSAIPVNNDVKNKDGINFRRAQTTAVTKNDNDLDSFINEQKNAQKSAKRQQLFMNSVFALIAVSSLAGIAMWVKSEGWLKRFKLDFKDLTSEKGLADMALPEAQAKAAEKIKTRINNYGEMMKKGGKKGSSILFYGPPGTGKNTFAYAIEKEFPNAKFIEMDISKLNSMWHGESEKNVLGTMDAAVKYAKNHRDEKIFVFIDEIDSVMMKDAGVNGKLSNDVLNAFKKGFNKLANEENIIVIGATNLNINMEKALADGKVLDPAMLDRFSQKVLVDLPTKDQILECVSKFYNSSERGMVEDALKDTKDARWDKIATFLSDKNHGVSFRKLMDILGSAAESTPVGKNVTFDEIIKAIKENKENLNVNDADMQAFLNSISK